MSDYKQCPRCKGKGEIEEEGWDFDESDPLVRGGKKYGIQKFRCPICEGEGKIYDPGNLSGTYIARMMAGKH